MAFFRGTSRGARRATAFPHPRFHADLSSWLNRLIGAGFVLERFGEPYPDDGAVRERPGLQDAQVVAYFLHIRARKPAEKESLAEASAVERG